MAKASLLSRWDSRGSSTRKNLMHLFLAFLFFVLSYPASRLPTQLRDVVWISTTYLLSRRRTTASCAPRKRRHVDSSLPRAIECSSVCSTESR